MSIAKLFSRPVQFAGDEPRERLVVITARWGPVAGHLLRAFPVPPTSGCRSARGWITQFEYRRLVEERVPFVVIDERL